MLPTEGWLNAIHRLGRPVDCCVLVTIEVVASSARGAHEQVSLPYGPYRVHVLIIEGIEHFVRAKLLLDCLLIEVCDICFQRGGARHIGLLEIDLLLLFLEVASLLISLVATVNSETYGEKYCSNTC